MNRKIIPAMAAIGFAVSSCFPGAPVMSKIGQPDCRYLTDVDNVLGYAVSSDVCVLLEDGTIVQQTGNDTESQITKWLPDGTTITYGIEPKTHRPVVISE